MMREVIAGIRRRPGFTAALVFTLLAAGFNATMVGLMALRLDELLPGAFAEMNHFTEPHHRIHDLTFSFLFLPALVGTLLQFRRPRTNVAGQVMAMVPSVALLLTLLATVVTAGNARTAQPPWLLVMVGVLGALTLHPAGRTFFRSFRISRASWPMVGLLVLAAGPLLAMAATNIGLQGSVADDHAAGGHYGFMAAFALTVLLLGLVAALRPDGWQVTAWMTGLLPVLLGGSSLIYSEAASALDGSAAVTAIAWGVLFVATALGSRAPAGRPRRGNADRTLPVG